MKLFTHTLLAIGLVTTMAPQAPGDMLSAPLGNAPELSSRAEALVAIEADREAFIAPLPPDALL